MISIQCDNLFFSRHTWTMSATMLTRLSFRHWIDSVIDKLRFGGYCVESILILCVFTYLFSIQWSRKCESNNNVPAEQNAKYLIQDQKKITWDNTNIINDRKTKHRNTTNKSAYRTQLCQFVKCKQVIFQRIGVLFSLFVWNWSIIKRKLTLKNCEPEQWTLNEYCRKNENEKLF